MKLLLLLLLSLLLTRSYPDAIVETKTTVDTRADAIVTDFVDSEGTGDTTGAAATGDLGMTVALKKQLVKKAGKPLTDKEAATMHVKDIITTVDKDFSNLTEKGRDLLTKFAYNTGTGSLSWSSIKAVADKKDATMVDVGKAIMKTVTIGGSLSKGLVKRRAADYNNANPTDKITKIEVVKNKDNTYTGTYYLKDGTEFFSVTKKTMHTSSRVGTINL